jgi:hypothetical protein
MKAEIEKGLLVLKPANPTEEYALRMFLEQKQTPALDGSPAVHIDHFYIEECDD